MFYLFTVYVKALPQVLYGKYSMKRVLYLVSRLLFECYNYFPYSRSIDGALTNIEYCRLGVYTRHTKDIETYRVVLKQTTIGRVGIALM